MIRLVMLAMILSTTTSTDDEDAMIRLRQAPRVKRIIGGDDITKGEWPWLVNLRGKIPVAFFWGIATSYTNYYCGGSIVDKQWVLTAAHCFSAPGAPSVVSTPKYWHIKAGDITLTETTSDSIRSFWGKLTGQESLISWYLDAQKIIVHPQYKPAENWKNDIALVKLVKTLPLYPVDKTMAAVSLPDNITAGWPLKGTNCVLQGWGCTVDGGPLAQKAKSVQLPALTSSVCDSLFGPIGSTRLCAGYNMAAKGICLGDSGGPLVCQYSGMWKQAGIASYTSKVDKETVPGVFTRVSSYTSWIRSTIANN